MRLSANLSAAALASISILAGGFVISLALNLPGHLSFDSVVQLVEGRTGHYGNWHPPVMSWLLGIADSAVPGTALFVVFDTALLFGSLASLLLLRPSVSRVAPATAALLLPLPQVLLYQGIVWKDVLFADAAVAGFVCLAHAAARWQFARQRFALLAAGLVLLSLAALTRQNGMVVLPFGAAAIGWTAARRSPPRLAPLRLSLSYGLGALGGCMLLIATVLAALAPRTGHDSSPATQFHFLQTYDLAGALAAKPDLDIGRIEDDDPALAQLMRGDAARLYTPQRNDTLASSARLQAALRNVDEATIPAQWRALVEEHPGLYLKVRLAAFRWVVFTPEIGRCVPFAVGVMASPEWLGKAHLKMRMDARDLGLMTYATAFLATPLFSHAFYAVLALAELVVLLRRREAADIAIAAMLLASFAFMASFFVIALACDYRYLYFLDAAALMAVFYLSLDGRAVLRWFAWRMPAPGVGDGPPR